jgi:hypothetical protein
VTGGFPRDPRPTSLPQHLRCICAAKCVANFDVGILPGELPRTPGHRAWRACPNTPSNLPPPFVQGLLSHKNRHLFTSGLQILSQHAFFADYSDQFRPLAGDNTFCPCNDVPFTPILSPLHSGPPTLAPIHRYSINHVLFDCRLHSDHRASTIGGFSSQYIFSTEAGGRRLAQFLLLSQQGLRCWKRSLAERKSSQRAVTRYVTCDRLYPVIPVSDRLLILDSHYLRFIILPRSFRFT